MKILLPITRAVFGLTGAIQLILGVVFWTGHALGLVSLHMAIGSLFVLSLWTLAGLCARAGAPSGMVVAAVVWGVVVLALGMTQTRILPGTGHWVIGTLHLLTAIIAMGLGGALTARTRKRSAEPAGLRGSAEPRSA